MTQCGSHVFHLLIVPTNSPRIALTGGPCGGKSTFIQLYPKHLLPWHVITVEESASALKVEAAACSIKFRSNDPVFQQKVLHRQLRAEQTALLEANSRVEQTIVLTDRGMFDSVAFIPFPTYEAQLEILQLTPQSAMARYDAIVFLRSFALFGGAIGNNSGVADLNALQKHVSYVETTLLAHLSPHPNLIVIDAEVNFREKMWQTHRAIASAVDGVVSFARSGTCDS